MVNQERSQVRHKLDRLATWTPEELDEELPKWDPDEVNKLWNLLEVPYQRMCRAFGVATPRQRVSFRGVRTHQQIKRLMVLQQHAETGV